MAVKSGKSHSNAVVFDALVSETFDNVASVGAGVANTVLQARLALPFRCKIRRVVATASGIGTGGTHSVQVVAGVGAPGAVGGQDVPVGANAIVLAGGGLVMATADTPVSGTPGEPDAIYPSGALLTLRAVTPASTGLLSNLKVTLAVCPIDGAPGDNNVNVF